ncbi:MAG: hypothetical protein U9N81_02480 [Bacillota bacterium]|nr:hypothetical protein [Bacillota bacterium]
MNQENKRGVPVFIFVLIPAILIGMYVYAAFFDVPAPEQTITNFYEAYFDRDFDTVAENLSVFWAVGFLPDYEQLPPDELLSNRIDIMKKTAAFIAGIEQNNTVPQNVQIEILQEYTREAENSAIVAYQFIENEKTTSMEAAILIRENGKFRIFNMTPVDPVSLQQIQNVDISILDKNFEQLLTSKNF